MVVQEDATIVKRSAKGIGFGKRFRYLFIHEPSAHNCAICKKYQTAKFALWYQKGKVAQLKMSRPSLKVSSFECLKRKDVFRFCNNILSTHCTNVFGGKPSLWDFLKDVVGNQNRKKEGYKWNMNNKGFTQTMKMYCGRHMCDFFQLNFAGPSNKESQRKRCVICT
jgi:hypothetical protein